MPDVLECANLRVLFALLMSCTNASANRSLCCCCPGHLVPCCFKADVVHAHAHMHTAFKQTSYVMH
eukprot:2836983-Amphidinium_carterae.1